MELVGRVNRSSLLQQHQRRGHAGLGRLEHGLVFRAVFVGFEEDFVELLADGCGALAVFQGLRPIGNLLGLLLLLFNGYQGLRNDFGRRFFEAALSRAAKVVRRAEQAQQGGGLLLQRGVLAEILRRQVGKAKLVLRRKLPGQLNVHLGAGRLRGGEQLRGRGLFKAQQDVRRLDLDALARVQLDLGRALGLRQDTAP